MKSVFKGCESETVKLRKVAKGKTIGDLRHFKHGVRHKWNNLMRTVPIIIISSFQPLEDVTWSVFIFTLSNRRYPNDLEREVLELPPRLGGEVISNP